MKIKPQTKAITNICYSQSKVIKTQVYNLLKILSENYTQQNALTTYILNQLQTTLQLLEVASMNISYLLQNNKPFELIAVLNENIKGVNV